MRLLTHNFLKCNETQCDGGYPLLVQLNGDVEENMKILEQEINVEFVKNVLTKLDYDVLCQTAKQLGINLLASYTSQHLEDEEFLNSVHHALFKVPKWERKAVLTLRMKRNKQSDYVKVHIMEATLICPKCNAAFPIKDGIPNMLSGSENQTT